MKKVKIISVTDLNGEDKDKHVWGSYRVLLPDPPRIGEPLFLYYEGFDKVRRTSLLKGIHKGFDNQTDYYTLNSIYRLEELKDETVQPQNGGLGSVATL